jgi:type IV pilus assembly protein PilC
MAKRIQRTAPAPVRPAAAASASPGEGAAPRRARGRIPSAVVTEFTTQLATLTGAGIPIVKALTILEGQTRAGPFKGVLQDLVEDVSAGTALSESLAKHPRVFDPLYSSMVRAGEAGGVLDRILLRVAAFREKAAQIRAKVVGALIYPAVVACVAVAVVSAVIVWVIPKFKDIFESFDAELPGMTRTLLEISDFAVTYWYVVFGVPFVLFLLHTMLLRRSQGYRYKSHRLLLRLPLVGGVLSKALIASFARTFGTLVEAGVPHLDALSIVRDASANEVLIEGVEHIRRTVREGEGIARPMGESRVFDDLVINMVDVGEQTGELDRMLLQVADAYERSVDRRIEALFKLVEPALLIAMAGVVGFIVVALFMPLMTIMGQLGSA